MSGARPATAQSEQHTLHAWMGFCLALLALFLLAPMVAHAGGMPIDDACTKSSTFKYDPDVDANSLQVKGCRDYLQELFDLTEQIKAKEAALERYMEEAAGRAESCATNQAIAQDKALGCLSKLSDESDPATVAAINELARIDEQLSSRVQRLLALIKRMREEYLPIIQAANAREGFVKEAATHEPGCNINENRGHEAWVRRIGCRSLETLQRAFAEYKVLIQTVINLQAQVRQSHIGAARYFYNASDAKIHIEANRTGLTSLAATGDGTSTFSGFVEGKGFYSISCNDSGCSATGDAADSDAAKEMLAYLNSEEGGRDVLTSIQPNGENDLGLLAAMDGGTNSVRSFAPGNEEACGWYGTGPTCTAEETPASAVEINDGGTVNAGDAGEPAAGEGEVAIALDPPAGDSADPCASLTGKAEYWCKWDKQFGADGQPARDRATVNADLSAAATTYLDEAEVPDDNRRRAALAALFARDDLDGDRALAMQNALADETISLDPQNKADFLAMERDDLLTPEQAISGFSRDGENGPRTKELMLACLSACSDAEIQRIHERLAAEGLVSPIATTTDAAPVALIDTNGNGDGTPPPAVTPTATNDGVGPPVNLLNTNAGNGAGTDNGGSPGTDNGGTPGTDTGASVDPQAGNADEGGGVMGWMKDNASWLIPAGLVGGGLAAYFGFIKDDDDKKREPATEPEETPEPAANGDSNGANAGGDSGGAAGGDTGAAAGGDTGGDAGNAGGETSGDGGEPVIGPTTSDGPLLCYRRPGVSDSCQPIPIFSFPGVYEPDDNHTLICDSLQQPNNIGINCRPFGTKLPAKGKAKPADFPLIPVFCPENGRDCRLPPTGNYARDANFVCDSNYENCVEVQEGRTVGVSSGSAICRIRGAQCGYTLP